VSDFDGGEGTVSQPPVRYATSVDGVRIAFTIDGAGEPLGVLASAV